jgi:Fe-S oxidoreductase
LQQNGCEVVVPRSQACCGAIHYHSGVEGPALDFARRNIQAFDPDAFDAIIVNAAGCGAMLKDYDHLLPEAEHAAAARFAAKVRDISEFLVELGPIAPRHPVTPRTVTYHDACHLCHGQQVRAQPRQLLQMIPGLELVPLEESEICCGAAGTYNLTQPEMSAQLGRRKMDHLAATGAEAVATGNIGCILQIARQIKERGTAPWRSSTPSTCSTAPTGGLTPRIDRSCRDAFLVPSPSGRVRVSRVVDFPFLIGYPVTWSSKWPAGRGDGQPTADNPRSTWVAVRTPRTARGRSSRWHWCPS